MNDQLEKLIDLRRKSGGEDPTATPLPRGGMLIRVPRVSVEGWNRPTVDVLFVTPPGYPGAQPDCFWIEPSGLRLADGATPNASNDSNPIPDDIQPNRSATWFSWHVQTWNPSRDSMVTYFKVIMDRLKPAR